MDRRADGEAVMRDQKGRAAVGGHVLRWLRAGQQALKEANEERAQIRVQRAKRKREGMEESGASEDFGLTATDVAMMVAATRWISDDTFTFYFSQEDWAASIGITSHGAAKCIQRLWSLQFLEEVADAPKPAKLKGRPDKSYRAVIPSRFSNARLGKSDTFPKHGGEKVPGDFPKRRVGKDGGLSQTPVRGLSPTHVWANKMEATIEEAGAPLGAPPPDSDAIDHQAESDAQRRAPEGAAPSAFEGWWDDLE